MNSTETFVVSMAVIEGTLYLMLVSCVPWAACAALHDSSLASKRQQLVCLQVATPLAAGIFICFAFLPCLLALILPPIADLLSYVLWSHDMRNVGRSARLTVQIVLMAITVAGIVLPIILTLLLLVVFFFDIAVADFVQLVIWLVSKTSSLLCQPFKSFAANRRRQRHELEVQRLAEERGRLLELANKRRTRSQSHRQQLQYDHLINSTVSVYSVCVTLSGASFFRALWW